MLECLGRIFTSVDDAGCGRQNLGAIPIADSLVDTPIVAGRRRARNIPRDHHEHFTKIILQKNIHISEVPSERGRVRPASMNKRVSD